FLMQGGVLVSEGRPTVVNVDSRASSLAGSLYVTDEIRFGDLIVAPGLRLELIQTQINDYDAVKVRPPQVPTGPDLLLGPGTWHGAWLPGVGASWQPLSFLSMLAGVHKGFSPVSPGQPAEVLPEEAWSYEAG